MMQFLRKHMKWIFLFVAICFIMTIFFVWGMGDARFDGDNKVLATAAGKKITEYEFNQKWWDICRENNIEESSLPPFQVVVFKKQVLNEMIFDILMNKYISEGAVKLTPEDNDMLKMYIRMLCYQKYKVDYTTLTKQQFMQVEQEAKAFLRRNKIRTMIQEQVKLSDNEVLEEFAKKNQQRSFKYINIDISKFLDKVTISGDDAKKYYETNKSTFKAPERFKILLVSGEMTEDKAKQLSSSAEEKKDLAAAAVTAGLKAESREFTASDLIPGVDFDASQEIKDFISSAVPGGITKPIKSRKGYAVAQFKEKVPEDTVPFEAVKAVIENKLKSDKAFPLAEFEGKKLILQVDKEGKQFEQAAAGYSIKDTGFIKFTDQPKSINSPTEFIAAGFSLARTGNVRMSKHSGGYYLLKLSEIKEGSKKQADKEIETLKTELLTAKQKAFEGEFSAWLKKKYKVEDNSDKVFTMNVE